MAAKRQKRTRNEEVFKSSEDVPAQSPSGVKDNPEKPIVGREKREKGIADADERREKSEAVENGAVGVTEERQKQEVGEERKSFWLIKSEPHEYSLDMLKESPNATGFWDGVRNHVAKNMILTMKVGDECFFYHSSCKIPAVVGIAKIVAPARPDPTAMDPKHKGFDAKNNGLDAKGNPRWFGMDVQFVREMKRPVSLTELKSYKDGPLKDFSLLHISRLSVHRVSEEIWKFILDLEEIPAPSE